MKSGRLATVLVVDDDAEMRAVLRDFLESDGHRVIEGARGEDGVVAAESADIDIAIVDKEMPGIGGLDLLSFFRARRPEVPVILVTAFGGPVVAEEARRRGAACYLEKPFRFETALTVVRGMIERRERAVTNAGG